MSVNTKKSQIPQMNHRRFQKTGGNKESHKQELRQDGPGADMHGKGSHQTKHHMDTSQAVAAVVSRLYNAPTISTFAKSGASKSDVERAMEKRKRYDSCSSCDTPPTKPERKKRNPVNKIATLPTHSTAFRLKPEINFTSKPATGHSERLRKFSGTTKSESYTELKKRTTLLEVQLTKLEAQQNKNETTLKKSLHAAEKKAEDSTSAKEHAVERLQEKEKYYEDSLECKDRELSTLQQRVENCQTKLIQCSVDPVTLKPIDGSIEKEMLCQERRQAALAKAMVFRKQLEEFNGKSRFHLEGLKDIMGKCLSTTVIAVKSQY